MEYLLMTLLFLTALFLIMLVLVQRGRGGGLAGAFGGLGGQSAFGTKAGDLFTRITIGVAAFWIVLCAFSVWYFSSGNRNIISSELGRSAKSPPVSQAPKDSKATPAPGTTKAPTSDSKAAVEKGTPDAPPADAKAAPPPSSPPATAPAETTPAETPEKAK